MEFSKFVQLSENNLISNSESIVNYLNLEQSERALLSMPLNYSFGLSVLNSHLQVGASILLTSLSIITKEYATFFDNYQPTSISGVPYFFSLMRRINFLEKDINSLKYLAQAGGKMDNKLLEYYQQTTEQKKINFIVMYGQTEATARISYLPSQLLKEKLSSVGIPIPKGKIEIINESGRPVNQPDVIGEIQYKGPNIMIGYAEQLSDLSNEKNKNQRSENR